MQRLYQASGHLQYGLKPVPGATFEALDWRRLRDYLVRLLGGTAPVDSQAREEWEKLLCNLNLMTVSAGPTVATIDGLLLFGRSPNRYLPQSGIRAICYSGTEPDHSARIEQHLRGPMVPLRAADGSMVEIGLVEQAWDFVRRNTMPSAYLDRGRRIDRWEYPEGVFREAVVNALVHRDSTASPQPTFCSLSFLIDWRSRAPVACGTP